MTFKLQSELTFPWPVKVMEPDPSKPGKYVEHTFTVMFKMLPSKLARERMEARRAILAKSTADTTLDELKVIQAELDAHDAAALREIVTGWSDLLDEHNQPIPFTDVMFRTLYEEDRVRIALNLAYGEAINQDRARLGN